jgi:hypothetical protein
LLGGEFGVSTALGLGLSSWLLWFITILYAATNPERSWTVVMEFNRFGEGPFELVLALVWILYTGAVLVLYNKKR